MCGIVGLINYNSSQNNNDLIKKMLDSIKHRGPDDYGIMSDNNISVGMVRLSIIDTSYNAHQPMSNEDESIWIVYNGETYNYSEEKDILLNKGYRFRSNSDTEVVLKMYQEYGDNFLLRMQGIFALAIYDKRDGKGKERILLARDQLGVKPLLYTQNNKKFIFASEMKAILASNLVKKEIEPEALRLLLTFGSIYQPFTIIKNVKMLMPGHKLIINSGNIRIEKYWELGLDRIPELRKYNYNEQKKILHDSLEKIVKKQIVSDVPIGAFLSGGVDSSLLTAYFSKIKGDKIKTFSVGFEDEGKEIDETDDALKIAKFIGTDHTKVTVKGKQVYDKINHIINALDQPTVDGVNSYFVSLAAKQKVTVAISGTGGDELFAGYPWFWNMQKEFLGINKNKIYNNILSKIFSLNLFRKLYIGKYSQKLEKYRVMSGFLSKYVRQYLVFGSIGTGRILSKRMKKLCNYGREPLFDIKYNDELSYGSTIERVTALCLRGYTQNQLLRDIDAVSMSHSLEVRVPFLDTKLVDIALSLPDNTKLANVFKMNGIESTYREIGAKKILIDITKDILPKDMDLQKKRGFGMPFTTWLKGPLRDVLEDVLSYKSIINRGFFDFNEVNNIKLSFFNNQISWALPWLLMIIELWCREFID